MEITPLALTLAFFAGAITVLSPCTLPIVPVALAVGGTGSRRRLAGMLVGFGVVFVVATVVVAAAMAAVGLTTSGLRVVAVISLAVAGLAIAVPAVSSRIWSVLGRRRPAIVAGPRLGSVGGGFGSGLGLGAVTGLLWAPCTGPIMAGVIVSAATLGPSPAAVVLAGAYVAGVAVPLALIGLAGRGIVRRLGSPAVRGRAQRALGVVLILSAVVVGTGFDQRLLTDGFASVPSRPTTPRATPAGDAGLPPPIADSLPDTVVLEDLGPTPEFAGLSAWINSSPLTMASLRGKVVLVHFWTFGCINCIHVQPYVKAWADRYAAAGFVVIGIHTPELSFERDLGNVRQAVADRGVRFPVAMDPDFATWNAFGNGSWPAFHFIDRDGHIRFRYGGEGNYDTAEQVIRELLAEPG